MSETHTEQLDKQLLHTIDVEEVPHIRRNKTYPDGHPINDQRTFEQRVWDSLDAQFINSDFRNLVPSPSHLPDEIIAKWWNIIAEQNQNVTRTDKPLHAIVDTPYNLFYLLQELRQLVEKKKRHG